MKKLVSLLLLVAVLLSLAVPAAAFSDITDATTQKEVAILQMMGIIDGTSETRFSPNGKLTRAQFCKMAVMLMGHGDEVGLYMNRTIFPDVRSTHWARGYINLAVTIDIGADAKGEGGTKLIRGMGDGTFRPDKNISYAEALAILVRLLGYSDADAGMNWPKGYLDLGAKIGLTKGMSMGANDAITRAQTAHLFVTMLTTPQKDGPAYYNQLGTVQNDVVLMDANATADDGTAGALGTSDGVYKTVSGKIPAELIGSRGALVTNAAGKVAAFIPVGEQKTITVSTAQAGWVTDRNGTKYTIPQKAPAYTTTDTTTYDEIWMDIMSGRQLTLFYSVSGKIEAVYLSTAAAETAMVARSAGGNPFAALVSGVTNYSIYRDGSLATLEDICLFDVATYDSAARILRVSSAKLTGRYDNVWPNTQSPSVATILGVELDVMPMAMEEMAQFKLGATVTALLTADGQIAGVVAATDARADNTGILTARESGSLTVSLLNGLSVSGKSSSSLELGSLVSVGSTGNAGTISVTKVSGTSVSGALDVTARKVGTTALNSSCVVFERIGNGALSSLRLSDLTVSSIPNSKITYAHKDANGKIDVLVLNDVTGDLYEYGMLKQGTAVEEDAGGLSYTRKTVILTNSENPKGTEPIYCNTPVSASSMYGIALNAGDGSVTGVITLSTAKNVKRSAFQTRNGDVYAIISSQEMPVAADVQCYNAVTKTWFKTLADARAFSDNLTVYYDRPASEGGKIRIVVAETE